MKGKIHTGEFNSRIEEAVSGYIGERWKIREIAGSTEDAMHPAAMFTGNGYNAFVKEGSKPFSLNQFTQEAWGLKHIKESSGIKTPDVIDVLHIDGTTLLIMEGIDAKPVVTDSDWAILGRGLAELHKTTRDLCGLEIDNYLGIFKQVNTQTDDWLDFYANRRLRESFDLAESSFLCGTNELESLEMQLDALIDKMPDICGPDQPFSLLHGDSWIGNMLFDGNRLVLIDPSIYYGNRELDISTVSLFKPVPECFFDAYNESYPLEPGYKERIELWRLNQYLSWMALPGLHGRGTDAVSAVLGKYI
jgi:fructosamine-3-kinase